MTRLSDLETSLQQLSVGQRCRIVSLVDSPFKHRLFELGFVPGTIVSVKRFSPLRDPVEFELRDTRVCLRQSETRQINVHIL